MSIRVRWVAAVFLAAFSAAGCQVSKSSNPLSPSVAGPIAGVNISQPKALEPGQDWQIFLRDQPIRLLFENAATNGQRAITYTIEIAADATFNNIVYKRTGISPGTGPTTTFQLSDPLATGRTYWWHVRAEDGANSSDYSVAKSFVAVTPVTLGAPSATAPSGSIPTTIPEFKIQAGSQSGPIGKVVYTVQVANDQAFASIAALFIPDETRPETTVAQNYQFLPNKTYYWRVQARDTGDSQAVSAWSSTQVFTTDPPAPPPPPVGGGGTGGAPPSGNGNWQACGSTPGYAVVDCVRNAVYRNSTIEDAFNVTKRVAWLLRGSGYGLLRKDSGENIIEWQHISFSISRVCGSDGHPVKVLSDAGPGGTNGAAWGPDPSDNVCVGLYIPAMNPDLP